MAGLVLSRSTITSTSASMAPRSVRSTHVLPADTTCSQHGDRRVVGLVVGAVRVAGGDAHNGYVECRERKSAVIELIISFVLRLGQEVVNTSAQPSVGAFGT